MSYTPISKQEADQAIREISQITFGLANQIPGLPKRERGEPPIHSKNKDVQARTLYQLAKENGVELELPPVPDNPQEHPVGSGEYLYEGDEFTIRAKDPRNVQVEKHGQTIFRVERGVLHENNFKPNDGYGLEADLKQSIKERNAQELASKQAEQSKQAAQEKEASPQRTRNPHQLAKNLHELNLENGKKGKNDIYEFEGENYTIRSRSGGNVTLTRKGEDTPAFKVSGNRVKTNKLRGDEIAAIHRNIQVQRKRNTGGMER